MCLKVMLILNVAHSRDTEIFPNSQDQLIESECMKLVNECNRK
jgi:hypothetical protein